MAHLILVPWQGTLKKKTLFLNSPSLDSQHWLELSLNLGSQPGTEEQEILLLVLTLCNCYSLRIISKIIKRFPKSSGFPRMLSQNIAPRHFEKLRKQERQSCPLFVFPAPSRPKTHSQYRGASSPLNPGIQRREPSLSLKTQEHGRMWANSSSALGPTLAIYPFSFTQEHKSSLQVLFSSPWQSKFLRSPSLWNV